MSKRGLFNLGIVNGHLQAENSQPRGPHGFDIPKSEEAARAAQTEWEPAVMEAVSLLEAIEQLVWEGKSGRSS